MNWTLHYGEREAILAEWNVGHLRRRLLNQGIDTVRLDTLEPDLPSAPSFAPEKPVVIAYGGQRWFYGVVTQTPTVGRYNFEGHSYTISGPWWFLEHLVYQQNWRQVASYDADEEKLYTVDKGRVVLGQDEHDGRVTAAQQIRSILQYAVDQGAPFAIGDVLDMDFYFPFDEIRDISCAEALQRILRWTPDAVVWFDYGAKPFPRLHCMRQCRRGSLCLALSQLHDFEVRPRYDLQVNSVVLKYEFSYSENGRTWKKLEIDPYPTGATGREFKSLVLTLALDGARTHVQRQVVRTVPLACDAVEWWQDRFPLLKHPSIVNLSLQNVRRETQLPNELIEGAVGSWMKRTCLKETIRAQVRYHDASGNVVNQELTLRLRTTDAITKTYERVSVDGVPTPVPTGLAKVFYDATAPLQHDGYCRVAREEVFVPENWLSKTLTIDGGLEEWKAMRAPVQEVCDDVDGGFVSLRFGPPKHLGPDDLIQLLRSNRVRAVSGTTPVRSRGNNGPVHVTEFPEHGPLENGHVSPGSYEKLILKGSNGQMVLDAGSIPAPHTVRLREYKIVDSGVLKSALFLSSEGY
jgi:hypothetical protein